MTGPGLPRTVLPASPEATTASITAPKHRRVADQKPQMRTSPVRLRRRVERYRQTLPRRVAGVRKRLHDECVALTFDDGPHPKFTNQVLEILDDAGVLATFFLVGRNAERHAPLVERIVAAGHAIGSHSHTHPRPQELGVRALVRDYATGHAAVEFAAGRRVRLFRPPHGHLGMFDAATLRGRGLRTWIWSAHAADWEADLTPDLVAARLQPVTNRDVVLLHDWIENPLFEAALDRSPMVGGLMAFLDGPRTRERRFVTLEDDSAWRDPPK